MYMRLKHSSFLRSRLAAGVWVVALLAMALPCLAGAAPDSGVSGTWKRGDTKALVLKADGAKLTGTILVRRAMAAFADGKVEGKEVSFKLGRFTYRGAWSGDETTLTRTDTGNGLTAEVKYTRAK
jgi:hypothetical protein